MLKLNLIFSQFFETLFDGFSLLWSHQQINTAYIWSGTQDLLDQCNAKESSTASDENVFIAVKLSYRRRHLAGCLLLISCGSVNYKSGVNGIQEEGILLSKGIQFLFYKDRKYPQIIIFFLP